MKLETPEHSGGMNQNKSEILFASLQAILDNFPDMMFVKDMNLTYVAGTKSFAAMLGKPSIDEVLGRTDYEIFEDKELSKRYTADDRKVLDGGKNLIDYVEPLTDENGEARYGSTSKYILTNDAGDPIGLLGISKDITKEMKVKQQEWQEMEYLFTLPENTYTAFFIDVTDWRIIGQRRQSLGKYIPLFDSMESFLTVARANVCDEQSGEYEFYQQFSQKFLSDNYAKGKNTFVLEYRRWLSDGNSYGVRDELKLVSDPENGHLNLILLVSDISSKRQEEQTVKRSDVVPMQYEVYNSYVVEHSNSVCYISDMENYDLLHLTKAGMNLHGMTKPEEYLGKKCYKVLMGLDGPCSFCTNNKLKEGQEYRWERYNDNINRWFDMTSSIIHLNGRRCHLEIGRDITSRKEELSLLSGRLTMEDVLFRCLHTLTTESDMDTAVNLFLKAVGGYYQANRAYIFEFDMDLGFIDNTFEWCQEGISAEIDNLQKLPLEVVAGWIRKFEEDGEFSISSLYDDLDHDSEEYRILEAQGIESLMAAPLIQDGMIVGFIGVDDPKQNQGNLLLLRSVSEFVQAELERRRLMTEMERMSYVDTLTGMKNRNQYDRVLKEYDQRTPDTLGVVYVDINGMKGINEAHGNSYGDHIIKKTGRITEEHISGTVFRTGGDEFIGLTENISKEDFQREVLSLRSAFEAEQECNVSVGCIWREREENIRSLLQQASELLAVDKQSYYHTVLQKGRETSSRTSFSGEVVKEIEEGKFIVYYQPQVDIQTGQIIGAEALVRKKGENGSLIPPNKFIPFYEMEGVISYVDLFVMRCACASMRQWNDQGHHLHLSVNFSRVTLLEQGIVDEISGICEQYGVQPSSITIEVTESISKMDHEQLKELIQTINDAGFTISLDDFGSQYSNLAILAAMDFDEIKFDKSLIESLENNRKSQVVMENSVRMCHDLEGTSSLAEGIETKGQLELLLDYQCDYGQGYYFSKPVPPEEFQNLLEETLGK